MIKKIGLVILALIVIGGAIGYYMFNKKPDRVEDLKSVAITADSLYKAFATDEASANKTFLSKVFDVSGKVQEVSKNQDGQTVVILGVADDPLSGVQCTLRDPQANIAVGEEVKIKGFCNGYTMVVILSDCILNK